MAMFGAAACLSLACGGNTGGSTGLGRAREDAAAETETPDGSGDASLDSGGSPVDASFEPPPHCVPPCIWRAILACTPPKLEVCQHAYLTDAGALGDKSAKCEPESGWFVVQHHSGEGLVLTFGRSGLVCYSVRLSGKGQLVPHYYEGAGLVSSDGSSFRCSDDGRDYPFDPSRPECSPWVDLIGTVVVTPPFECESFVSGSCDSVLPP